MIKRWSTFQDPKYRCVQPSLCDEHRIQVKFRVRVCRAMKVKMRVWVRVCRISHERHAPYIYIYKYIYVYSYTVACLIDWLAM
jgi:hypothetical protein